MQHFFNTRIANLYGISAAVISQHFWFWVNENKAHNNNNFDGRWWVYESIHALSERFDYMTENQIRKAINDLVKDGILCKGNFNKTAYDRTTWYTFTESGCAIFTEIELEFKNSYKQIFKKRRPIPI